ncbi:MAG TPA: dynamin family protein [Verrucomicrobiae bacterium]|nr:dynamin family protein [Verrucomicrobiae bacterium]
MSRVDADAMRRYERARDELAARLTAIESLVGESRRTPLHRTRTRLERGKFVLAVVGEFSSGKSFLLNALLGKFRYEEAPGGRRVAGLLATDINPSTATITELEYGAHDEAVAVFEDGRRERIPLDALTRFVAVGTSEAGKLHDATEDAGAPGSASEAPTRVIVKAASPFLERGFVVADTPGLASINPAHRRATLQFLPTADAVLYLIDTQQPFTEGDASFLGIVRRHIDSIFIVQTKIDLWRSEQSDGRPAWEHAYERISRLAAMHAHGTYVYALSAREYVEGRLDGDAAAVERSRFPQFLAALDASLIRKTGRARLLRASERATATAQDEIEQIDRDLAMLALGDEALREARAAVVPELDELDRATTAEREALLSDAFALRRGLEERGRTLAGDLERALAQTLDAADIAKIRDRERLHVIVDRVVAHATDEFARETAATVAQDVFARLERAKALMPLRWSANDAAARAFGATPGTSLWSGDPASAIAATIVLEAIGGPAIGLVHEIATRFAGRPPGSYMKRELVADLRADIFPRLRNEIVAFAAEVSARLQQIYDDLAQAIGRGTVAKRDADLGSIERALQAHVAGDAAGRERSLRQRREALERESAEIGALIAAFMEHEEEIAPADPGPDVVRGAHDEASFDPNAYDRGLRPERWRVAVLGALRRGKSSLINAFAGTNVLRDDVAGSVRFPIHVRYGERQQAFALAPSGEWREIAFEDAAAEAAGSPVLVLVPWKLPKELVLVHAPAFDSGDAHADDVNVVVASHASEVLCLFSRQLSDRELDLYERVAEFGRPMLFAHTIADNEAPNERRHVVELAQQYLRERNIPVERVFTVSAAEYGQAAAARRAPAPWNETEALRSTLEAHAESHMARLDRLAKAHAAAAGPAERGSPAPRKPGLFGRLFGKGH